MYKVTHTKKPPQKTTSLFKTQRCCQKITHYADKHPLDKPHMFLHAGLCPNLPKMLHFLNQFPCSPPLCWTRKEACFVLTCVAQFVRVWPDREISSGYFCRNGHMYLYEASENTTTAFLIWWKSVNKFGAPKTRLCVFNCALGSSAEGIFLYFF